MRSEDDTIDPYWIDEADWLVDVVTLSESWSEEINEDIDYIGRLFAFASATDTRFLVQVGNPKAPAYELWFSFKSEGRSKISCRWFVTTDMPIQTMRTVSFHL